MTNLGGKKSRWKETRTDILKLELARAEKKMTHKPSVLSFVSESQITPSTAKARDEDSFSLFSCLSQIKNIRFPVLEVLQNLPLAHQRQWTVLNSGL